MEMRKLTALLATAIIVATSAAARATNVEPGFAPSATGCPTFWEVDGGPADGDIDPPVGPFGTSQLHVTGFGFTVDSGDITMTIRVADMQRRVAPGFNQSWWIVALGDFKFLRADYDLVSDSFTFTWVGPSFTSGPATGSVVLGPGGGVSITAKLADLGIGPHYMADMTRAVAGRAVDLDPVVYASPGAWSSADGPELVPLVPCPGLALSARLDPRVKGGVVVNGVTLPKVGGQPVELQLLSDGQWTTIGTGTSQEAGAFEVTATAPSGSISLRGVVTTAAGVGTSALVELAVP